MKRALFIADTHCGNRWGLTPPGWWSDERTSGPARGLWEFYLAEVSAYGKLDLLILGGDLLDGPGRKDSKDLIDTDPAEQRKMAATALGFVKAKQVVGVRGTPFHVSTYSEEEDALLHELGGEIYGEMDVHMGGKTMNIYHTGRRSDTPHMPPAQNYKEMIRKQIQADLAEEKSPDIVARAHVHYFFEARNNRKRAFSLPALRLPYKDSYARRIHTQYYDVGMVLVEINERTGEVFVRERIMPLTVSPDKGVVYVN